MKRGVKRGIAAAVLSAGAACAPRAGAVASVPAAHGELSVASTGSREAGLALSTGVNKPNGFEYRYRQSVPPGVPGYVPRTRGAEQLWIADSTRAGWLAFYRTPPEPEWRNSSFTAALYGPDGTVRWTLPLNPLLSRTTQLEIQDIRLGDDGDLYFNEACQTYARDADRQCSGLLRVDPVPGRVVWRTAPLISNNVLLLEGPFVIAGYGFTAEPDSLYLVARADGRVVARLGLDSAHQYLELVPAAGGTTAGTRDLLVLTNARHYRLRIR
jgi:hypothetical protein